MFGFHNGAVRIAPAPVASFVLAWMLIGGGPAALSGEEPSNLVLNGDFVEWQDGKPSGWTLDVGAVEGEGPSSTVTHAEDGPDKLLALRLEGNTETRRWLAVTQGPWSVAPGDALRVRGWMRTREVRPDGHRYRNSQIALFLLDSKGNRVDVVTPGKLTGTADWQRLERGCVVPHGAVTAKIALFLSMSGRAEFADIRLERAPAPEPDPSLPRQEQWGRDLEYLRTTLPLLHPDPFSVASKAEFEASLRALGEETETLDDLQIAMRVMKTLASLGDSHTRAALADPPERRFPVGAAWLREGLVVVIVDDSYASLLGGTVLRVGGLSLDPFRDRVRPYVSHENEAWLEHVLARWLSFPRLLFGAGVIESPAELPLTVRTRDGVEMSVTVTAAKPGPDQTILRADSGVSTPPLFASHPNRNYWFEYLEKSKTLYCRYSRCRQIPDEPIAEFTAKLFEVADTRPVERFVLDLRGNTGGSSPLIQPLIRGVAERAQSGEIARSYLIVGRQTFSSAILNAAEFMLATGALVVGEPTGGRPNHFGQVAGISLPHSGLRIRVSTKTFRRLDDDPATLEPDILVRRSYSDLSEGRDPVLEAVLQHDPEQRSPRGM
jgi:hypothetical protein